MSDLIKKIFYRLGIISAYHWVKNKNVLTVIMLHRVLPTHDSRWSSADQEWTVSEKLFSQCIAFLGHNYHFVSHIDILESLHGRRRLPARPLLLTFDDGWSDNFDFAYPILRKKNIPALIFVAASAVGRKPPFWREAIVIAMRAGYLTEEKCREILGNANTNFDHRVLNADDLINALSIYDEQRREQLLVDSGVYNFLTTMHPAYMLAAEQMNELSRHNIAIGVHGHTHNPITADSDWWKELQSSRDEIQQHLGSVAPSAFSFPHGRYDGMLIKKAFEMGYSLLFTSNPFLVPLVRGQVTCPVLGRIHFASKNVTDERGEFAPEKMAFWLFKRSTKNISCGDRI